MRFTRSVEGGSPPAALWRVDEAELWIVSAFSRSLWLEEVVMASSWEEDEAESILAWRGSGGF